MSTSPAIKHALVVGGTSGIGHGAAIALASKQNVDVTIAGRSATAGNDIVGELTKISPGRKHKFLKVDCFDMVDVKRLAEEVKASSEPLDILVMTQGMATIQGYTPTKSGLDQKLSLHFYSRVLLANLLTPKLSQSTDPRVMSILSGGVHSSFKGFKEDTGLETTYSNINAANCAGFYNDLAFDKLASISPEISWAHAAPGFVNTNWGTEMPWYIKGPVRFLQIFGRSKELCGENMIKGMDAGKKGFNVVDQNGAINGKCTSLHSEEAKDVVFEHTQKVFKDLGVL